MADQIFIIGMGSAGKRHALNALALGCEVIGYDVRTPTPELLANLRPGVTLGDSLEDGLAQNPLGVIVATPPDTHKSVCLCTAIDHMPVLIEKPLATTSEDASLLAALHEQHKSPLAVGYQLRFTPTLRALKARIDAGEFGRIQSATFVFRSRRWSSGTYDADFLLEVSHELDCARWLLGNPTEVRTWSHTPDAVEAAIIFTGPHGKSAVTQFILDGTADGYERGLRLWEDVWITDPKTLDGVGWTFDPAENEQAYVDELRCFLAICRLQRDHAGSAIDDLRIDVERSPLATGHDGWWALRMVEAIRRSGTSGRWEAV